MQLTMLKSKLHRGVITDSALHYVGSITIDPDLMDATQMLENEKVDILNINNGERFATYIIKGVRGSGDIIINGAAARLVQKGDLVIICAFALMDAAQATLHEPVIVQLDAQNKVAS